MAAVRSAQYEAMKSSGLRAFSVARAPEITGSEVTGMNWVIWAYNVPDAAPFGSTVAPTREGALALAAGMFAAYPDVPVIG